MRMSEPVAYFIMNVEIFMKRIAPGEKGLIVRNVNSVVEVVEIFQRHGDGRSTKTLKIHRIVLEQGFDREDAKLNSLDDLMNDD